MPIIREVSSCELHWAVWELTESESALLNRLPTKALYTERYDCLKTESRRREFLAVRALLVEMTGREQAVAYHEDGKPYLKGSGQTLSISHTHGQYVAVLLADEPLSGIDIELRNDRVMRVRRRFVSPNEELFLQPDFLLEQLLLIWSAKESMYKALPGEGIDFLHHLEVLPFEFAKSGLFYGREYYSEEERRFEIAYHAESDYVLTIATRMAESSVDE